MNAADRLAEVVTLPARGVRAGADRAIGASRMWIADNVDDWGRDNGFVNRVWALSHLRWNVAVGGAEHVPKRTGALVVVNARRLALAPVFAALAIGGAVDRPVRFVGRTDVAPLGAAMQRMGALLALPDEVEGALRAGELVVLGAEHTRTNRHCGRVDHALVGAAVAARVPVLPAAATSIPTGRTARVEIAERVRLARNRRGPLQELELADAARQRIDVLLDELGALTGTPLDWLP
jgi:1-acyl-sn-glycerol-3-phosphate acyltransferase